MVSVKMGISDSKVKKLMQSYPQAFAKAYPRAINKTGLSEVSRGTPVSSQSPSEIAQGLSVRPEPAQVVSCGSDLLHSRRPLAANRDS
jgi:hypothetical protein